MIAFLFLFFMSSLNTQQNICNAELVNQIYLNKYFYSSLIRDKNFFLDYIENLYKFDKKETYYSAKEVIYSFAMTDLDNKCMFCLPRNYNKLNLYKALFILELFYQSCLIFKKNRTLKDNPTFCSYSFITLKTTIKETSILEFPICFLFMFYEIERSKKYSLYKQNCFHHELYSCLSKTFESSSDIQKITFKALNRTNQLFKKKQTLTKENLASQVTNVFVPAEEETIGCLSVFKKAFSSCFKRRSEN